MNQFLDQYEPLDIIGNGSFGIIRKVRRKSDGLIFARKELNFERMSERDRKQIVAEVNILKDLHHDHIVRYHDRYVDREAGILYILMEYCGGGDLSTIIKQAQKHGRPIPEDTIWNYFMQILLALHHCHHPNGHARSGSTSSGGPPDVDGKERRAQILHRDLKPDNVFLSEENTVKLGDFGLSKALAQSSFANTYVGTPYYMSPELMQEKAYDSKSDIWSLGCLIYELCALKPPFHEAKTHAELSILIRNGRIPPLPRGYSQALAGVIKAMLNLNPAMRPSATQLLQHERLELSFKVSETEKMLSIVKSHKADIDTKERELLVREARLTERESQLAHLLSQKDNEIRSLKDTVSQLQQEQSQQSMEIQIQEAVHRREEELRVAVAKRETEVATAMAKREEEIMEAIRKREAEICEAWRVRETQIRKEVAEGLEERVQWVIKRTEQLGDEEERLEAIRIELEEKAKALQSLQVRKDKAPLEEVKNLVARETEDEIAQAKQALPIVALQTPIPRISKLPKDYLPSAMKGVVLTATGEPLATPSPTELTHLFDSPRPGLEFSKIFELKQEDENEADSEDEAPSPPPSPSERDRLKADQPKEGSCAPSSSATQTSAAPTRLRRPSIRAASRRLSSTRSSSSLSSMPSSSQPTPFSQPEPKPLPHPHLHQTSSACSIAKAAIVPSSRNPPPHYDFTDEENLPSPFLKKIDRDRIPMGATIVPGRTAGAKRHSNGNMLRAVAAANAAGRKGAPGSTGTGAGSSPSVDPTTTSGDARPSIAIARKASEEARKALQRS